MFTAVVVRVNMWFDLQGFEDLKPLRLSIGCIVFAEAYHLEASTRSFSFGFVHYNTMPFITVKHMTPKLRPLPLP